MAATIDETLNQLIDAKVKEALEEKLKEFKGIQKKPKRLAIAVVSKGTIDGAYPALILATAAAAMGMEAGLYFSFFGLNILKKDNQEKLKLVPLGNPALPMPLPNWLAVLPGMTSLATTMMKREIKKKKIASVSDLMDIAVQSGVKLWPCQMAMDMFDIKREDLMDGLPDPVGAATFLEYAGEADITLYI
jgi:peroxiredoxin family protein